MWLFPLRLVLRIFSSRLTLATAVTLSERQRVERVWPLFNLVYANNSSVLNLTLFEILRLRWLRHLRSGWLHSLRCHTKLFSLRRAVEFCKSAFTLFGFFGTLFTRPAPKSQISARASTLQYPPNYSHPERRRLCRRSRMGITSNGQVLANEIISKIIIYVNKYPTHNQTLFFLLPIFFYEGEGGN